MKKIIILLIIICGFLTKVDAGATIKNSSTQQAILQSLQSIIIKSKFGKDTAEGMHISIDGIATTSIDNSLEKVIVENRPARVYFTVWNNTQVSANGYVLAEVQPTKSFNAYGGDYSFPVKNLAPGKMISGVIAFKAPHSDKNNTVIASYYNSGTGGEFPPVAARASMQFDVAAKYSLSVTGIHIYDIAAQRNDTVFLSLSTFVNGATKTEQKFLGDYGNNDDVLVRPEDFKGTNTFNSIPGVSPNVSMTYIVANWGHSEGDENTKNALGYVSDAGGAIATAVGSFFISPAAAVIASEAANALHHLVIDTIFADKDRLVAFDTVLYNSQQLYDLTFDPDDRITDHSESEEFILRDNQRISNWPNWLGDNSDSHYRVDWKITRYRNPKEDASANYIELDYGANTTIKYNTGTSQKVSWQWSVEGDGSIDNHGNYQAPPRTQDAALHDVVYGRGLVNGIPTYSGFTVILLN